MFGESTTPHASMDSDWAVGAEPIVLSEWVDAADASLDPSALATALDARQMVDRGRRLAVEAPDNVGGNNYCGVLRTVPAGDFVYAARLTARRKNTPAHITSVFYVQAVFVDGVDIDSTWYGCGLRSTGNVGAYTLAYGNNAGWQTNVADGPTDHPQSAWDVLVERSGTSLRMWTSAAGANAWTLRRLAWTVGAGAGLFGLRIQLGNGATGHDVVATIGPFRRLPALPIEV